MSNNIQVYIYLDATIHKNGNVDDMHPDLKETMDKLEFSENEENDYDYLDGWEDSKSHRWEGLLSKEELYKWLRKITYNSINTIETMGVLGGIGANPWYSIAPAIGIEGIGNYNTIANLVFTPFYEDKKEHTDSDWNILKQLFEEEIPNVYK